MLPVELIVVPKSKVAKHLLSRSSGHLYKTMISIGDPGSRYPTGYRNVASRIRVECEDSADETNAQAPTRRDVHSIVSFAPVVAQLGGRCLIHCEAGISRSTAAAAIIARVLAGPGSESEAVALIRKLVPEAAPNRLMIRYADELIENCRLAEALDKA